MDASEKKVKPFDPEIPKMTRIIEQSGDHVIVTDIDGNIEYVNPAFEKLTGYTKEEVVGKTPRILKSGKYSDEYYQRVWEKILSGNIHSGITINKKKNGELYYEDKTISPLKDKDGNITHFISTGKDVTERIQSVNALEKKEYLYRKAIEVTEAVPYYLNYSTDSYEFIGGRIKDICGYSPEEMTPQLWDSITDKVILLDELEGLSLEEATEKAKRDDGISWKAHYLITARSGEKHWVSNSAIQVRDEKNALIGSLGILQDITRQKKDELEILHLAYYDSLTDLPNRMLFNDRLNTALSQARRNNSRVAVMLIDLDRFKTINDSFGHEAGDSLLQEVAKQIKKSLRQGDTLARMGGDEFLVLLQVVKDVDEAATVSRRILRNLNPDSMHFQISDIDISLSASIGISIFPND